MDISEQQGSKAKYLTLLTLSAIGVVYGDIGTSPLYALRECFHGHHAIQPTHDNVLGILSLIFWALVIIISVKYLVLVLRADNEGEGGILALMALVRPSGGAWRMSFIVAMGLFGAALLYGDGIITPAISVLSAVEGLNVITPFFTPYILPITLIIIFILFAIQHKGTGKVGKIFGPVSLLWFITMAVLGVNSIIDNPEVLNAVNPYYAYNFFIINKFHGFFILGSVFLVVTGGEALYADMGHFGRFPIRAAWFSVVLPALLMNYFGQGALLLKNPEFNENPFYYLAPEWALFPLVMLATLSAAIASQAVISGAFSLTYQALLLGFLPRIKVVHTSEEERGQIYIPRLNWTLFAATVVLVLSFKSSSNLAAAYGIAVSSAMVITTILSYVAMRKLWNWSVPLAASITLFFLAIDGAFLSANFLKFFDGGWIPIVLGAFVYFMMATWNFEKNQMKERIRQQTQPLENFIMEFLSIRMLTIPGTAVYMSSNIDSTPPAMVLNIKHNKLLHKQIIILTVRFAKKPRVPNEDRVQIEVPTEGFYKVIANYGFMEVVNIQDIIPILIEKGIKLDMQKTTFFLGRETIIPTPRKGFQRLKDKIFVLMTGTEQRATDFFCIPPNRVFEVGTQVEM